MWEIFVRDVRRGAPPIYPWREVAVGETFDMPYCNRCAKSLIKQAEKATHRKFECISAQTSVTVVRIK